MDKEPAADRLPFSVLLQTAKEAENTGDLKAAATTYLQCVRQRPTYEFCYNRLMIIYRKLKLYNKEEAIISKAIKVFEQLYSGHLRKNQKVEALSKTILKSTGLVDAKGRNLFDMQPVKRWKQRLVVLHKKTAAAVK